MVLDRVLISGEGESMFPLLGIQTITRLGETENIRSRVFHFEPSCLLQEGFRGWLSEKWPLRSKQNILDHWYEISYKLRKALRGWGANCWRRQPKKEAVLTHESKRD